MTARLHHHVSQCYLKGFVVDRNKPKLFVVDIKELRSFTTNPVNVAVERDFHRIDVDGHPPDALENNLSRFESELDQALLRPGSWSSRNAASVSPVAGACAYRSF